MNEYLLWLDIETTGLNPSQHVIIELAYVLTDFNIKNIFKEKDYIINPDDTIENIISNMDPWCIEQHTKSNLLSKIKESKYSVEQVENLILNDLHTFLPENSKIYLAGNSVHFDKMFLNKYMKNLSDKLSHRILDVSSFAIMFKNLYNEIYDKRPLKKYKHTALSDIWESINEYIYYVENTMTDKN